MSGVDLTLTDIADEAGIHYTTLMKVLPLLEELGMVSMTRQVGNANELNFRLAEREAAGQEMPALRKEMALD